MMSKGKNMLERAISIRRPPYAADGFANHAGDETGDESKTRKHSSIAIRLTNYLIRSGYFWPVIAVAIVLIIVTSVFIHSRDLVCISVSSADHTSRLRFFGFDGLETDFGALGVPWCKCFHLSILHLFIFFQFF